MNDAPVSTYRLQLNAAFGFDAARALVPYLHDLGVDWLYLSPIATARRASTHGYDVVDPTTVSPALGGRTGLEEFAEAAHCAGMKLLVDIVPNHEAVTTANAQWYALLRDGPDASPAWFDVDWTGNEYVAPGKVLWGMLTEPDVDAALDAGTLRPEGDALVYGDERLPWRECETRTAARDRLSCQRYQLAHWRTARPFLNYRRFFEVSELAGVRVEDPAVFDASHALVFDLLDRGVIDGVRVDHIDGLAAPAAYLDRLVARAGSRPVFVEKILTGDESLPTSWPVCGTTGYETIAATTTVLLDPDGVATLTRAQQRVPFATVEAAAKREVLRDLFVPEWHRIRRELPTDGLASALEAVTVALGVYRTYLTEGAGHEHLTRAVERVRAAGSVPPDALDALQEFLTADGNEALVRRWEQTCSAVMAKGREDTALYRSPPVLALAEVGCDPGDDARDAVARFHAQQHARAASDRPGMTATTTHDTKRSEDTRARLAVLTELAHRYVAGLGHWIAAVAPPPTVSRGVCDFVAQTLLASWPHDTGERAGFAARVEGYVTKALREAKQDTSWLEPDERYEAAVMDIARRSIASDGAVLYQAFGDLVDDVAWFGAINGLAQLTWKLGLPGTCDVYRGTEFWDLSLVDPDNRRPVDFDARRRVLDAGDRTFASGALKLQLTAAGLRARRAHRALFFSGAYLPLRVSGDAVLAFARHTGGEWAVACAPRLPTRLAARGVSPVGERVWGTRVLPLPAGAPERWHDVFTGRDVDARDGAIRLATVFAELPVALLVSAGGIDAAQQHE